jgi:hypothetical protein
MASNLRVIGYNIKEIAEKNNINIKTIADSCGLSINDIQRVMDGRLVLTPQQFITIAKTIGCDSNVLFILPDGFVAYGECVGNFRDHDNEEKILNIIDDYIDIVESITNED